MNDDHAVPMIIGMRQMLVLIGLGVVLWFFAALLIRAIEPLGALRWPYVWLTYALAVPGTAPFLPLIRQVAGLRRNQIVTGIAVVTGTATVCDANTLLWFPALYGADPVAAAAAVFWGAGVGLLIGVALQRLR